MLSFLYLLLFLITLAHFDPPSSFGDSVEVVPGIYMFLLPALHYVVLLKVSQALYFCIFYAVLGGGMWVIMGKYYIILYYISYYKYIIAY